MHQQHLMRGHARAGGDLHIVEAVDLTRPRPNLLASLGADDPAHASPTTGTSR